MLLLIVSFLLLCLFLYIVQFWLTDLSGTERFIAYYLIGCAHIILILEIAGLLTVIDSPYLVLAIQLGMTAGAFLLSRKKLAFPQKISIRGSILAMARLVKQNPFLSAYISLLGVAYIFLFVLSTIFPQNTGDALYNHLSRIGYWLQQGSLAPYNGFNKIGVTYPYNNSLLMLWTVLFTRRDALVGSVQFTAALSSAAIIYYLGTELGFARKNSLIVALLFLTFPIVLLQATTAQNDLLTASFLGAAFAFALKSFKIDRPVYLILSGLAFGLAIGAKQYAFFILPGYLVLILIRLIKSRRDWKRALLTWAGAFVVFTLLVGSYSYLQNGIHYGNIFGKGVEFSYEDISTPLPVFLQKAAYNSARLFTQFVSCQGLPPGLEQKCSNGKAAVFRLLFVHDRFDIESDRYILEPENPFNLDNRYLLNEESAWFGFLSWLLILPGMVFGLIFSIRRKRWEGLVLILSALLFFVIISVFKKGWDQYLGRHLFITVMLLMPFTAGLFGTHKLPGKMIVAVICAVSLFVAAFTIVNNDSRPLLGKSDFASIDYNQASIFGKLLYRVQFLVTNEESVWELSQVDLQAVSDHGYVSPLELVNEMVPEDAVLGIVARGGYVYDYLFFGETFGRKILPIKDGDLGKQPDYRQADYLLVTPDFPSVHPPEFSQLAESEGWRILVRLR